MTARGTLAVGSVFALLALHACTPAQEAAPPDEQASPLQTGSPDPSPATEPDPAETAPEDGTTARSPTALLDTVPAGPRHGAPLPGPRTEVTGTFWEGRVVAVGGLDAGGAAVARVDLYDPRTDAWEPGPDLPIALHHTAVVALGERVYVVGGYSIGSGGWVAQAAVWSLGPGEDAWREEPPLATPRGALAAASTGDAIVAVGGVSAGTVLASTEILRAGAEAWEPGPDLTTAREHLDATAVGGEVYAIAGRAGGFATNRDSVEVLRDGAWHDAGTLNHARGGIGAATVDSRPCVAGGEEPGRTIATVECLSGDGTWEVVGELEVPRHGLVVAAVGSDLHAIGGGPEPGLTVSDVHEVIPIPS